MIADPKLVSQMRSDPRRQLVNFVAGFADNSGLQRGEFGADERLSWDGLEVASLPAALILPNGGDALAFAYGFTHNDQAVLVLHAMMSGDPEQMVSEVESHLATWRVNQSE